MNVYYNSALIINNNSSNVESSSLSYYNAPHCSSPRSRLLHIQHMFLLLTGQPESYSQHTNLFSQCVLFIHTIHPAPNRMGPYIPPHSFSASRIQHLKDHLSSS